MNTYRNPIKKQGDFADPFVLRHNGRFYLYGTNPDVRCWSSEDLVNWTLEGATVPEEEFPGLVPFAPEVVYWNGSFYMYTSPHGFGHYVLKSDSPTGPFQKITGNIGHSIDFSIFIDDDGEWYAYWADDRGIQGCKMNSPTEFGEEVLVGAYLYGWTEGPFVVKQDGKYHLTYTGNHFLSKGYRIHAAIADNPLGPYHDDSYNPVVVCTEGDVVGLGHSSTVLGPDLHTHYIAYHNLNPDKTRDLNIDPVVFTPQKAYVLGPTVTPRPVPVLPQWRCSRFKLQNIKNDLSEDVTLPAVGVGEFHLAAGKGISRYGIAFAGAEEIRLEFDIRENMVSVLKQKTVIACEKLLFGYNHEALHSIRIAYDKHMTVYVDNLKRIEAEVILGGSKVGYYSDDCLKIGSAAVHPSGETDLHYPVPCMAPGDRNITFDVTEKGKYQLVMLECHGLSREIQVDGQTFLPEYEDRENHVAFYSCELSDGSHVLNAGAAGAEMVCIVPHYGSGCDRFTVRDMGPFDKIRGKEKWTNTKIHAELTIQEREADWQAGVLFRALHLADGREGNDKKLGTNFFVGYRVCAAQGKIQLWKHRYDEELLVEAAFPCESHVSFEIITAGNLIYVRIDGKLILEYRDPKPILYGYNGFHGKNCMIEAGSIQ